MKVKSENSELKNGPVRWLFWSAACVAMSGMVPGQSALGALHCQQDQDRVQEDSQESELGDDLDLNAQLASFDQVWKTIKDTHWDEEKVGQAWDETKRKYRSKVESAKSIGEVRGVLEKMVNELGQSHFGIIPVDSYDVVKGEAGDGYAGLSFRLSEDEKVLVTQVVSGSPAAKAGIGPGWQLLKIGSKDVDSLLPKLKDAAHGPLRFETIVGMTMDRLSTGKTGSEKEFVFLKEDDEKVELAIEMVEQPGKDSKFGNLPTMRVNFDRKTVAEGIGYFYFNVFFDPARVMTAYQETIRDPGHTKGMVIDLRGNIGGLAGMTMGMARPFAKEKTKLGTMITRGNRLNFAVFPDSETYQGPVAVLIDECSISSAEILSGGLKDIGAARIFGRRSAGLALPSTVVKLPNGDGLQYAIANYISESGQSLEGDGVVPDELIPVKRNELLTDGDPVLNQAIKWIQSQSDSTN